MRFLECLESTGRFSMENYLWSMMMKSAVSRMQRFTYFQILCYVLERWFRTQHQILSGEDMLTWFKSSSQYRALDRNCWWANGIRVEYFPKNHHAARRRSPKVHREKKGDPAQFQGRIIFMSMFNNIIWWTKDNEQECIADATLVSLFAKRFPAGRWSFLGLWIRKEVVFYLQRKTTRRMGQSRWIEWWWNSEKADTQPSEPRVHCLEERSEAKEVENYRYTSVPMEIRLKLFFAQLFLLFSSVSTEQFQMCVRNTVPVKLERRDPCWQDNLTHCLCQQNYWQWHPDLPLKFPHKKIFVKVQKTIGKASTTRSTDKDLYWCRIPENSWRRTVLHDKAHWPSSQFTEPVTCREYTLPRDEKSTDPKGWIRGNTKIGPVLEVTTSYLQGKYVVGN